MTHIDPLASTEAAQLNRSYYESEQPGVADYWRLMAAPRLRMSVVLEQLVRFAPATVVDLGCGGGQVIAEIGARLPAARLHGIDLSAPQIEANRRRLPSVTWHVADLDGRDGAPSEIRDRMDAVVAMEVVEHLDRPADFLAGALRLAAPGRGRLVLTTQSGPLRETERRVGHRRHFTADEMSAMLLGAGWVPERVWNAGWPFHDLSKWYANRNPDASMDRFSARAYGPSERLVCWALRAAFRVNSGNRGAQLFAVARRP